MKNVISRYRRFIVFLLLLALYVDAAVAQFQLPEDIPTPNTASLGKYGFTPVSCYTGSPEISIPLYEFSARGVRLPVTLRHDASGVAVNSLPGWLGHNWSMEAGGVITRTVKGRYDEWLYPAQSLLNMTYTPKDRYHSLGVLPAQPRPVRVDKHRPTGGEVLRYKPPCLLPGQSGDVGGSIWV